MKIADASRPIDRESARAARTVPAFAPSPGSTATTCSCASPAPTAAPTRPSTRSATSSNRWGDTLAVVVHLQNAEARTRFEADTLNRNCQLAPGDRAFLQTPHTLDVLDPALRAQARADAERMRERRARRQNAGDRAAVEAIPEM